MALYIFSDAHFGSASPDKEAEKLARLNELSGLIKRDGDRLIILGDLFDFWLEYKHAMPKEHHQVLLVLDELVKAGIKVDYVSGNHDFWMDDFFSTQMSIPVHRDTLDIEYAGRKMHLIHGDGLAPADRGYRLLKRIFRNPINIWLYRKLPPDWSFPLAKFVSGSSRDYTTSRDHTFAADYEAYAKTRIESGSDVVVIAHLHIPICKNIGEGIYINTGDFISHFSYARLDDENISLEYLP